MKIQTFFWYERSGNLPKYLYNTYIKKTSSHFRVGNAGDIYVHDLLKYKYKLSSNNNSEEGKRILCVGSVSQFIKNGDVICGIGAKSKDLQITPDLDITIYGLRGPITYDTYKQSGFDVSKVKFLLDPGLLIRHTAPQEHFKQSKTDIAFIPHYRERSLYRGKGKLPKGMKMIDIDGMPHDIAKKMLKCKVIYTSSLHGVIFSHALGIPCVLVKPATNEPLLKYQDYFASVNLDMPTPLESIADANYLSSPDSPAELKYKESDFYFPSEEELKSRGVIR